MYNFVYDGTVVDDVDVNESVSYKIEDNIMTLYEDGMLVDNATVMPGNRIAIKLSNDDNAQIVIEAKVDEEKGSEILRSMGLSDDQIEAIASSNADYSKFIGVLRSARKEMETDGVRDVLRQALGMNDQQIADLVAKNGKDFNAFARIVNKGKKVVEKDAAKMPADIPEDMAGDGDTGAGEDIPADPMENPEAPIDPTTGLPQQDTAAPEGDPTASNEPAENPVPPTPASGTDATPAPEENPAPAADETLPADQGAEVSPMDTNSEQVPPAGTEDPNAQVPPTDPNVATPDEPDTDANTDLAPEEKEEGTSVLDRAMANATSIFEATTKNISSDKVGYYSEAFAEFEEDRTIPAISKSKFDDYSDSDMENKRKDLLEDIAHMKQIGSGNDSVRNPEEDRPFNKVLDDYMDKPMKDSSIMTPTSGTMTSTGAFNAMNANRPMVNIKNASSGNRAEEDSAAVIGPMLPQYGSNAFDMDNRAGEESIGKNTKPGMAKEEDDGLGDVAEEGAVLAALAIGAGTIGILWSALALTNLGHMAGDKVSTAIVAKRYKKILDSYYDLFIGPKKAPKLSELKRSKKFITAEGDDTPKVIGLLKKYGLGREHAFYAYTTKSGEDVCCAYVDKKWISNYDIVGSIAYTVINDSGILAINWEIAKHMNYKVAPKYKKYEVYYKASMALDVGIIDDQMRAIIRDLKQLGKKYSKELEEYGKTHVAATKESVYTAFESVSDEVYAFDAELTEEGIADIAKGIKTRIALSNHVRNLAVQIAILNSKLYVAKHYNKGNKLKAINIERKMLKLQSELNKIKAAASVEEKAEIMALQKAAFAKAKEEAMKRADAAKEAKAAEKKKAKEETPAKKESIITSAFKRNKPDKGEKNEGENKVIESTEPAPDSEYVKLYNEAKEKYEETGDHRFLNKMKGYQYFIDKENAQYQERNNNTSLHNETALDGEGFTQFAEEDEDDDTDDVMEAKDMEDEIAPIVKIFNQKGYKVKYASPGHLKLRKKEDTNGDGVYHGKLYTDARVQFVKNYDMPTAPKGWFFKNINNADYLDVHEIVYNPKNGSPDKAFAKWKNEYMDSLRKYANDLDDLKNKLKVSTLSETAENAPFTLDEVLEIGKQFDASNTIKLVNEMSSVDIRNYLPDNCKYGKDGSSHYFDPKVFIKIINSAEDVFKANYNTFISNFASEINNDLKTKISKSDLKSDLYVKKLGSNFKDKAMIKYNTYDDGDEYFMFEVPIYSRKLLKVDDSIFDDEPVATFTYAFNVDNDKVNTIKTNSGFGFNADDLIINESKDLSTLNAPFTLDEVLEKDDVEESVSGIGAFDRMYSEIMESYDE